MSIKTDNRAFLSTTGEGKSLPVPGRVKVSAAQTGGMFEMIEFIGPGSPLPHVHQNHDECFYIIEGTYTFTLGSEQVQAPADSVVFVPRGTRHSFKPSDGARAFVFIVPAHLEEFFRELGAGLAAGRPEPELRAELGRKYDSQPVK